MGDVMYRLFGLIPWVKRIRLEMESDNMTLKLLRRREELTKKELNAWLAEREVIGLIIRRYELADAEYPMEFKNVNWSRHG